MEMFIGPRGIGKTRKLVEAAAKVNGVIVCKDTARMIEKLYGYGYQDLRVISYEDFITCDKAEDKFFIVKLCELLSLFNIAGATVTVE